MGGNISSADSSKELFSLSGQVMGKTNTVLPCSSYPADPRGQLNEFFTEKSETIRSTLICSGTPFEKVHAFSTESVNC